MKYQFTDKQLRSLVEGAINMYREYVDAHGFGEEAAVLAATNEVVDGMAEERDLIALGVLKPEEATHQLVA